MSNIDYKGIADGVVESAKSAGIELDYSQNSLKSVDEALETFHKQLEDYNGTSDYRLWNLAIHYGVYIGETLLKSGLKQSGYKWLLDGELPCLQKGDKRIPLVNRAHKRIMNGAVDSIADFFEKCLVETVEDIH